MKLGLVAPFSGYDANTASDMLSALTAAVGQWNEKGGIDGYRILITALDDDNDPATAAQDARELAIDKDVVAAIARLNGSSEQALNEYSRQSLPVIVFGSPVLVHGAGGFVWQMCADPDQEGQAAAKYAVQEVHAARPAVVVGDGKGYGEAAFAFQDSYAKSVLRIDVQQPFSTKEADRLAETLAAAAPDFVYYSGPYDFGSILAGAIRKRLAVPILLGSDADTPGLAPLVATQSHNLAYLASCETTPSDTGSVTPPASASGTETGQWQGSVLLQETVRFVAAAIQEAAAAGKPSRQAVGEALRRQSSVKGAVGSTIFDKDGKRRDASSVVRRLSGS